MKIRVLSCLLAGVLSLSLLLGACSQKPGETKKGPAVTLSDKEVVTMEKAADYLSYTAADYNKEVPGKKELFPLESSYIIVGFDRRASMMLCDARSSILKSGIPGIPDAKRISGPQGYGSAFEADASDGRTNASTEVQCRQYRDRCADSRAKPAQEENKKSIT